MNTALRDFFIKFFVNRLSNDECVKLYAALLMSEDNQLSRQAALDKAFFSKRSDLIRKLRSLTEYGPYGPLS